MDVFQVLSDPTRRAILTLLAQGEHSSGQICRRFSMTGPAISQHLKALREARLVHVRVAAQRRFYRLEREGFKAIEVWLSGIRRFWRDPLLPVRPAGSSADKLYRYTGSQEVLDKTDPSPLGVKIKDGVAVLRWMKKTEQEPDPSRCLIVAFVVDRSGALLVGDRMMSHLAIAGGRPVLSAGEMMFQVDKGDVSIKRISNNSRDYCPEPESWPALEKVISEIDPRDPDEEGHSKFVPVCEFRRCTACENINLIKDNVFVCAACSAQLSAFRNIR